MCRKRRAIAPTASVACDHTQRIGSSLRFFFLLLGITPTLCSFLRLGVDLSFWRQMMRVSSVLAIALVVQCAWALTNLSPDYDVRRTIPGLNHQGM